MSANKHEVAKLLVRGTNATIAHKKKITSGLVGATIAFEVDSLWDDLQVKAVFKSGAAVVNASFNRAATVVPHEVVSVPGKRLYVGLYGVDVDEKIVIPTVWVDLGVIACGADPSGDGSADPQLPVWAELQSAVGDLNGLETAAKGNLVEAINEAVKSGGTVKTVNKVAPDAAGNIEIKLESVLDSNGKLPNSVLPEGYLYAVLSTEQTLTEEQKAQARENIGTVSVDYVDELFGEKRFDITGNPVQCKPKPGGEMEVITKISHEELWTPANTLELHQVNSKNVIDLVGYLGGVGTVYERNGLTATINADSTMTIKGTSTSDKAFDFINRYYYQGEYSTRVYPPGTYRTADAIGLSLRKAMYDNVGSADPIEGIPARVYGLFTVDVPFRIVNIFMAYGANAVVDDTIPLAVCRGTTIPDDGRAYSGIVHKVIFDNPVYEGEYNWTTGELKDADGNTIAFYEPNPILGLDGVNSLWTGFGEVTVRGKQDSGQQNEGAVEKFDPTVWGLPILALNGDITGMDKNHPKNMTYTYGEHIGLCSMKWQGSSSIAYDKKNFTISFDKAFEAMEGWGAQKKYCTKANYIDHSHARNVVCAKLWGETVKSRTTVPAVLKNLPNYGAVDGFPIIITINDEFQGLYTMNVPKDAWMFGMGSGTQEAIVCADKWVDATGFKGEAKIDGTDFKLEYASNEDDTWVANSLNRLINACVNSDGSDLDTTVAQYLDWQSAIDYYIFCVLTEGADMTGKNYLLATFDGVKWYFSAYDMDSTFGLHFSGKSFLPANYNPTFDQFASFHRVMELIKLYKKDALKARYAELRESVFSESNIAVLFNNFCGSIPTPVLIQDVKRWPMIPNTSANNVSQIRDYYRLRVAEVDKWIENL